MGVVGGQGPLAPSHTHVLPVGPLAKSLAQLAVARNDGLRPRVNQEDTPLFFFSPTCQGFFFIEGGHPA